MGSSTTTRNFGIRRFTNLVREGRFRAPVAADLMLGTGVEIDVSSTTDPQTVRQIAAAGPNDLGGGGILGLVGVLWYEHDSQSYVGAAAGQLVQDYNLAPRGRMVQVLHGRGAKVWFRNTAVDTTESGLNFPAVRAAVTMVAQLGGAGTLAVNDLLAWDAAAGNWADTAVIAEAVMRVTYVDHDLAVCDAEFLV